MSIDTVNDLPARVRYIATAAQVAFDYPFPIFSDGDLVVIVAGATLVEGVGYSVAGEGNDLGGTVTLTAACVGGEPVTIYRDLAIDRLTDFSTLGPFAASMLNTQLDQLTLVQQQLRERVERCLRSPIDSSLNAADLELDPADYANKYLAFDANGTPVPAALVSGTLTNAVIRSTLGDSGYRYVIHPLETAAGLVSANLTFGYDPGVLERYGCVGTGLVDDSAGLIRATAVAAQGVELAGTPGKTYLCTSIVNMAGPFSLDLHGATIKPSGNTLCLHRNAPAATASTTVSSGATFGSRTFVVASATGLVVGQWVLITANDSPTHDANTYPDWWAKIVPGGITGTTVTVDHPAPVNYSGTISLAAYNPGLIYSKFEVKNGRFDVSATTYNVTTGTAMRIGGYEHVVLDNVTTDGGHNVGAFTNDIQIYINVNVAMTRCRSTNVTHDNSSNTWDIQDCRTVLFADNYIDGSCFGINITRCEIAMAANNRLIGRRSYEGGLVGNSVRGIKLVGNAHSIVLGNFCCDYESPLKVQAAFRYMVCNNTILNEGPGVTYTGQIALNVGSIIQGSNMSSSMVCNNIVEGCSGVGIGVDSDTAGGKVIISGNITRKTYSYGIYCNVRNATITGNRVEDWDLGVSGAVGISHAQGGLTLTGNRFSHSTDTTRTCIGINLVSTYKYCIDGNLCETANALGVLFENFGVANIASGNTSTTGVAHGLSRTPGVTEFTLAYGNSPTNDPGLLYLSAAGSTTFVATVRSDPGASTLNIYWRAKIAMPFTV